jgi:hypothetical protein
MAANAMMSFFIIVSLVLTVFLPLQAVPPGARQASRDGEHNR